MASTEDEEVDQLLSEVDDSEPEREREVQRGSSQPHAPSSLQTNEAALRVQIVTTASPIVANSTTTSSYFPAPSSSVTAPSAAVSRRLKPWETLAIEPTTSTPPSPEPDQRPIGRTLSKTISLPPAVPLSPPARTKSVQRRSAPAVQRVASGSGSNSYVTSTSSEQDAPSSGGFQSASSLLRGSLRVAIVQVESDSDYEATATGKGKKKATAGLSVVRRTKKKRVAPVADQDLQQEVKEEPRPVKRKKSAVDKMLEDERKAKKARKAAKASKVEAKDDDDDVVIIETTRSPQSIVVLSDDSHSSDGDADDEEGRSAAEKLRGDLTKFTYGSSAMDASTASRAFRASTAPSISKSNSKPKSSKSRALPLLPQPTDPIDLPPSAYLTPLPTCPLCSAVFPPSATSTTKAVHLTACAHNLAYTALTALVLIENVLLALHKAKESLRRAVEARKGLFERAVAGHEFGGGGAGKKEIVVVGCAVGRVEDVQREMEALRGRKKPDRLGKVVGEIKVAREARRRKREREERALLRATQEAEMEEDLTQLEPPRPTGNLAVPVVRVAGMEDPTRERMDNLLLAAGGTGLTQLPSVELDPLCASISSGTFLSLEPHAVAPLRLPPPSPQRIWAHSRLLSMYADHEVIGGEGSRWAAAQGVDDELIRRRVVDLGGRKEKSVLPWC